MSYLSRSSRSISGNPFPVKKKQRLLASLLACALIFSLFYAVSTVSLAASASKVILSCTAKSLEIGDEMYLCAYSVAGKTASFKSSKPTVAAVNRSGKITALSAGTAKITATIGGQSAICTITVKKTTVQLCTSSIHIEKKSSYRLRATASNYSNITWRSRNPSIATVSATGVVTGKRPGTTTITASAGGTTVSCTVTVKEPFLLLSRTSLSLKSGSSSKIVATVSTGMTPTWTSSNPVVAAVDSNGRITAKKKGTAIITAAADGVKSKCTVTVNEP